MMYKQFFGLGTRSAFLCILFFLNLFLAATPVLTASAAGNDFLGNSGIPLQNRSADHEEAFHLNDIFELRRENQVTKKSRQNIFRNELYQKDKNPFVKIDDASSLLQISNSGSRVKPYYYTFLSIFYLY